MSSWKCLVGLSMWVIAISLKVSSFSSLLITSWTCGFAVHSMGSIVQAKYHSKGFLLLFLASNVFLFVIFEVVFVLVFCTPFLSFFCDSESSKGAGENSEKSISRSVSGHLIFKKVDILSHTTVFGLYFLKVLVRNVWIYNAIPCHAFKVG